MMTREEYEKTYIRMMDSLRDDDEKGQKDCNGVNCANRCPFHDVCKGDESRLFNAYKCIEIVEQWGKDHPVVTRADKFKEVFGTEPRHYVDDNYICPKRAGLLEVCPDICGCCDDCLKDFWESEYIEPNKGELK